MKRNEKIILFKSLAILIGLLLRVPRFTGADKFVEGQLIPLVEGLEKESK